MENLSHQKKVLQNLHSDKALFKKELYKSLAWLKEEEIENLVECLITNFWNTNGKEIISVFRTHMVKNVDTIYYQKTVK